jgi:hypothetical protein
MYKKHRYVLPHVINKNRNANNSIGICLHEECVLYVKAYPQVLSVRAVLYTGRDLHVYTWYIYHYTMLPFLTYLFPRVIKQPNKS